MKYFHVVLIMFVTEFHIMRKLQFLIISLVFASIKVSAQFDWQALPSAPTTEYRFDDVYFLNPQMGWAIQPIGGTTVLGQVWETRNGGATWVLNHDSALNYYRSVGFADSLTGWVGNLGGQSKGDTVPLFVTHDGGKTLNPVPLPNPKPGGICGISVIGDSTVYAYGRYFGPS